jgi:hypothetical protein
MKLKVLLAVCAAVCALGLSVTPGSALPIDKSIQAPTFVATVHLCHKECRGICGAGRHSHGSAPFCFTNACECAKQPAKKGTKSTPKPQ